MPRITFLVHKGKEYTVEKYLRSWGQELSSEIEVRNYPGLRPTGRTPWKRLEQNFRGWRLGTLDRAAEETGEPQIFVFTDIERLDPRETEAAVSLFEDIAAHPDTVLVLNHPTRSMRRFELLDRLHSEGINEFAGYGAQGDPRPRSWPVFIRDEDEHGFLSPLIHDQSELERALGAADRDRGLATKIVVEYCDTSDEHGVIRKFGAFRVNDRILARQVHFSRDWVVRFPDIKNPQTALEERKYVAENPHAEELLRIFELAQVDYGRIDYGLRNGRIQVWEINTNPMILIPADRDDPLRSEVHDTFGQAFTGCLRDLFDPFRSADP
jgi:hypothetical protein